MVFVNNLLLDIYVKCGNLGMVKLIFERMLYKRNVVFWILMIVGFVMYGYGKEVIKFFYDMEDFGIIFDVVIFVVVFYLCSYVGLVEEGCKYFDKMIKYGI